MVEKRFSTSTDKVYELLTNAKWLEQRYLDLGDLSAHVKVKRSANGAALKMTRRIKKDLPALVAKVLNPVADAIMEESWTSDVDGQEGRFEIEFGGQPIKLSAEFSLTPDGKSCLYSIKHTAKCSVPLLGRAVEKFAIWQAEKDCVAELDYLANYIKKHR